MIDTGYISFITESGGGFDGDGNPVSPVLTNSEYVPCNIKVLVGLSTGRYKTYPEGMYKEFLYSIIVDKLRIPQGIDITKVTQVSLQGALKEAKGTFHVQDIEVLKITNKIKLLL